MYQQTLSRRSTLDLERRLKLLYDAVDDLKEKLEFCAQKEERDFQVCPISTVDSLISHGPPMFIPTFSYVVCPRIGARFGWSAGSAMRRTPRRRE